MDSQYLAVVRVWAAMAWADGVLAPQEAAAMRRFIEASDELGPRERDQALGFLDHPVGLETAGLAGLAPAAREGIYRAALRLSAIDDDVAEAEQVMLGRLRTGLGLDEATIRRIEASIQPR